MIFGRFLNARFGLLHLPTFCLQLKSERPRLLTFGFGQLPRLASILASSLEWVDFLMNRVLILPERVHTCISPLERVYGNNFQGGMCFPLLAPSEVLLNNADTIVQFKHTLPWLEA